MSSECLTLTLHHRLETNATARKTKRTCLCFGFFEHTTYTLPFLLTTLHPSHITLTEALTFIPRASAGVTEPGATVAASGWWAWEWPAWPADRGRAIAACLRRWKRGRDEAKSGRSMVLGGGETLSWLALPSHGTAKTVRAQPQRPILTEAGFVGFTNDAH